MRLRDQARLLALLLLLTPAFSAAAQSQSCSPHCNGQPTPEQVAREAVSKRFRQAWDNRDEAQAEAALVQLSAIASDSKRLQYRERLDLVEYRIFERGQCDVAKALIDAERYGLERASFAEGLLVCQVLHKMEKSPGDARQVIAQLMDARLEPGFGTSSVYDFYARQPTINTRALQWLRSMGLDDPRTDIHSDGALVAQIVAGRIDNVTLLLGLDFDPNLLTGKRPRLPLQAVIDQEKALGEKALQIARLLLKHGADPTKLRWQATHPAALTPSAEFAALLTEASKPFDPLRMEFRGLLFEYAEGKRELYAKFAIGNGSNKRVQIPIWTDDDQYLIPGLPSESRMEYRLPGGSNWQKPLLIAHGYSPRTKLVLESGESQIVRYEWDEMTLAQWPADMEFRLWYLDASRKEHYSQPFKLHDGRMPVDYENLQKPRDWLKLGD